MAQLLRGTTWKQPLTNIYTPQEIKLLPRKSFLTIMTMANVASGEIFQKLFGVFPMSLSIGKSVISCSDRLSQIQVSMELSLPMGSVSSYIFANCTIL